MRKFLGFITIMFTIFFLSTGQFNVQAQEISKLEAKVSGAIEVGNEIEISIYTNNIKNLYTGDIRFKIDSSILQITSIEKGSLLNKEGVNLFEQKSLPTDNEGTKDLARYIFTAIGENEGYSGEGTIVVFKAKVLKKAELFINAKAFQEELKDSYNMRIDLVDSSIEYINYDFTPYGKVPSSEQSSSKTNKDKAKTSSGKSTAVNSKATTEVKKSANTSESSNTIKDKQVDGNNVQDTTIVRRENTGNNSNADESNTVNVSTEGQGDSTSGKDDISASNEVLGSNEENKEELEKEKENISENIEVKENQSLELKGEGEKGKVSIKLFVFLLVLIVAFTLVIIHRRGSQKKV